MNLQEYPWFKNPRGLRNKGPFSPLNVDRYIVPMMGWARLEAGSDEYTDEAEVLVANRCMPIVMLHRTDMGAAPVPEEWYATYQAYINAGCCWFELYDEPNIAANWPKTTLGDPVHVVSWENVDDCIAPLMDNWVTWAERIIMMGGYPAFPAMASSIDKDEATVYWLDQCLQYLSRAHYARFMQIVGNGLWCATHPQILNHFYQEPPGGPAHVARPYYQYDASESGWHFEYPYDPLMQRDDPGRTALGNTERSQYGDPYGLIATGQAFQELLKYHFNAGPLPVIGTAGGIAPVPESGDKTLRQDELYFPYNQKAHAEAILAIMEWIVRPGPGWFFGLTLSDEGSFYDQDGEIPAIKRLAETQPSLKVVPDIDAGGIVIDGPFPDIGDSLPVDMTGEQEAPAIPLSFRPIEIPAGPPEEPSSALEDILAPQPSESPVAREEDVPGWLADLGLSDDPATPAPAQEPEEEAVLTIGWLDELDAGEEDVVEGTAEIIPMPESSPVSGWQEITLPGAREKETIAEAPPSEPTAQAEEETLLDFDALFEPVSNEEPGSPERVEPTDDWQATPGWLDLPVEELIAKEPIPEPDMTGQDIGQPHDVLVSDLPVIDSAVDLDKGEEDGMGMPEGIPDWLQEEGYTDKEEEVETGWIIELGPGTSETSSDLGIRPSGEALTTRMLADEEPEEIPDWLKVDRQPAKETGPLDQAGESAGEGHVESSTGQVVMAGDEIPEYSQTDYHIMVFSRGFNVEWFYDAARRYWETYRPIIIGDLKILSYIPSEKLTVATLVVTEGEEQQAMAEIKRIRPEILIDLVIADFQEELRAEFEWRAIKGRRFG